MPFSFVEKDFATKKISYPRICLEFRFYHFYFPKFCMSLIHSLCVSLFIFQMSCIYCLLLKISAHNYSRLILSKCGCFFNSAPLLLWSKRFSLIEGVLYCILTNFNFTHLWSVQVLSIPKSLITACQIIIILLQLSHKPSSVANKQQQERQVLAISLPASILEEKVSLGSEHVWKNTVLIFFCSHTKYF